MTAQVYHAIEVITDDGTGTPVTYTNTAIGLPAGGHFYFITDRPGLDGGNTIAGDTEQDTWYEGLLSGDGRSYSITHGADFSVAGCMEQVSVFRFKLKNTAGLWSTLKTNGVNLGRCKVKYYKVRTTDGITFTFTQEWQGVVDETNFDELEFRVNCVSTAKDIFKSLPTVATDSTSFPNAGENANGKFLPIAMGRMAYSPLLNVEEVNGAIDLAYVSPNTYKTAAIQAYTASTRSVVIRTPGIAFQTNDPRLVGNWLCVIKGGLEQSRKIVSNTKMGEFFSSATVLKIEDALDETSGQVNNSLWASGTTNKKTWWVQVLKLQSQLIASTKPIYSFESTEAGNTAIYSYDSENKKFEDLSEIYLEANQRAISPFDYPAVKVIGKTQDIKNGLVYYQSIVPASVRLSSIESGLSISGGISAGQLAPLLKDRDRSTYYTLDNPGAATRSVYFDVEFPGAQVFKSYDEIYLLVDMEEYKSGASSINRKITVITYGRDIYEQITDAVLPDANGRLVNGSISSTSGSPGVLHYIPETYYGSTAFADNNLFYKYRDKFAITSLVSDIKDAMAFNVMRLQIRLHTSTGSATQSVRLKQIAFIGKKTINYKTEQIYARVKGECFYPALSTSPVLLYSDALKYLIQYYDLQMPRWDGLGSDGKNYFVGDKVTPQTPNGHFYTCTVAGISDNAEPTWPTTSGATVVDNQVTWQESGVPPIDFATFTALASQRADWFIGRTLQESKKSEEYYKDMLEKGFTILLIDATGKVKVKAWRENTTPFITFDSSNILEGTISEKTQTPMSKVYNDLLVKYDYNHGANKFNKQLFVTNIDKAEFPLESDGVGANTEIPFDALDHLGTPIRFTFPSDPELAVDDYVSLVGNGDGFDFAFRKVISAPTGVDFQTLVDGNGLALGIPGPSSSGTLYKHATGVAAWKTWVGGYEDDAYDEAKEIWELCHASYVKTKVVQKMPSSLSECPWFIDPKAEYPVGTPLWSDLAGVGDAHPAVYYLRQLAEWTTKQKDQISFEVPDTLTVDDGSGARPLEIGDPVYVNDAKQTDGNELGWIHEITQLPREEGSPGRVGKPERLRIGVTLDPT